MKRLIVSLILAGAACHGLSADNRNVTGTHAIGNGRVCVYGKDADLTGLFGPTYSSPTLLTATLETPRKVVSEPVDLTGVWRHTLTSDKGEVSTLTDFAHVKGDAFIRRIETGSPISFKVTLLPETAAFRDRMTVSREKVKGATSAWRISIGKGVPFYSAYESPSEYHAMLFTTGDVELEATDEEAFMTLSAKGNGTFFAVIADSPEALAVQMRHIRPKAVGRARRQSARFWKKTHKSLPAIGTGTLSAPERAELDSTVKLVSDYVLAQQDEGGGILAGKNYHMAYVRDQYGNSRGLLAMGHLSRARDLLDFYFRIWQSRGAIHNAQPMVSRSHASVHRGRQGSS